MLARTRFAPVLVAGALTLAACGGGTGGADSAATVATTDSAAGSTAAPPATAAPDAGLAPANVAALVGLTNASEIGAGRLAQDKGTNAEVKAFAKMMVADHQAMQKQLDSLTQAKTITPEPPAQAEQKRQEDSQLMATLNSAEKGAAFDKAYIGAQVQGHQKALNDLQSFTSTTDADLRALIEQAIPKVQAHLDRAQQIQSKLGTGGA